MNPKLIQVEDLNVKFDTPDGAVTAVNGLSFALERGQTFGIVGESGSGKSQSMLALMGLLAANGRASGRALFNGDDLLSMPANKLNRIRGNRVAMLPLSGRVGHTCRQFQKLLCLPLSPLFLYFLSFTHPTLFLACSVSLAFLPSASKSLPSTSIFASSFVIPFFTPTPKYLPYLALL